MKYECDYIFMWREIITFNKYDSHFLLRKDPNEYHERSNKVFLLIGAIL